MATILEGLTIGQWFYTVQGPDVTTSGTLQDLDLTKISNCRITTASVLESLVAQNDEWLRITTTAASGLLIKNETGTTAANRILTGTGSDYLINKDQTVTLNYDTAGQRWRLINASNILPSIKVSDWVVGGTGTSRTIDTNIDYATRGCWRFTLIVAASTTGNTVVDGVFGYNGAFVSQTFNLGLLTGVAYSNQSGKVRITISTLLSNTTVNVIGVCSGTYL